MSQQSYFMKGWNKVVIDKQAEKYWIAMISPFFFTYKTPKFSVIEFWDNHPQLQNEAQSNYKIELINRLESSICVDWNCEYTRNIIFQTIKRRVWCNNIDSIDPSIQRLFQLSDFENISWEEVCDGKSIASSYLIRKGLSRKAQFAWQIKRHLSKNPGSILARSIPETHIIETWNAFESEMKLDVGGGIMASFDLPSMQRSSLRDKLRWLLGDLESLLFTSQETKWILKPSVANKGVDISIITDMNELLDELEYVSDMREWVIQRYVEPPLLINRGHKFHIRVYVLCVGALRTFVFQDMLVLLAAHRYNPNDTCDMYGHLTNTARAAETINFKEEKYVKILRDLPQLLVKQYPNVFDKADNTAQSFVEKIQLQINEITKELFVAYENEYSIFCPMANAFELFGLDFLVSASNFKEPKVSLLEVNPGPDFKQTGGRLQDVIERLWEQVFRIVVDLPILSEQDQNPDREKIYQEYFDKITPDMKQVYNKEWSVASMKGGLSVK